MTDRSDFGIGSLDITILFVNKARMMLMKYFVTYVKGWPVSGSGVYLNMSIDQNDNEQEEINIQKRIKT